MTIERDVTEPDHYMRRARLAVIGLIALAACVVAGLMWRLG